MPKKNIMRRFRMSEISTVDVPAQEGAVATIMKNMRKAEPKPSRHSQLGLGLEVSKA